MADKITSPITGVTLFTLAILASLDNISCNQITEYFRPTFADQVRNVSFDASKMDRVLLSCSVYNLKGHNVSWIRVATNETLTIGERYVARSMRYYLYSRGNGTFDLEIWDVKKSDEGWFKCQVDTDPVMESQGYVSVQKPDQSRFCLSNCLDCVGEFGRWFEISHCVSLCYADRTKYMVQCEDLATMFPQLRSVEYSDAKCCEMPRKLLTCLGVPQGFC